MSGASTTNTPPVNQSDAKEPGAVLEENANLQNESLNNEQGNQIPQRSAQEELGGSEELYNQSQEVQNRLAERIRATESQLQRPLTQYEKEDTERQSAFDYAKEKGIWIDDLQSLGESRKGGNENTLVIDQENDILYKSNNLFNSHNSITEYFEGIDNHNDVFPENAYTFVGFTGTEKSKGVPYVEPVVKQDYVPGAEQASQQDIDNLMLSKGFEKINHHTFKNETYTVSDLRPRNVLRDPEGNIHVIDDIVTKIRQMNKETKLTPYHEEQNKREAEANKKMPKLSREEFKQQALALRGHRKEQARQRTCKTLSNEGRSNPKPESQDPPAAS